jgi:hypothetical protein
MCVCVCVCVCACVCIYVYTHVFTCVYILQVCIVRLTKPQDLKDLALIRAWAVSKGPSVCVCACVRECACVWAMSKGPWALILKSQFQSGFVLSKYTRTLTFEQHISNTLATR